MSTEIVVAIIAGIFSLLVPVVKWLLEIIREKIIVARTPPSSQPPPISHPRWPSWRIFLAAATFGTFMGYLLGSFVTGLSPESDTPPPPVQTPIPRGDQIMEINFDYRGDGDCNDYDISKLGYEARQYYIQPQPNGYIAICHGIDDLASQGSLEVTAWSDQEIKDIYGFAVLFGWKGEGVSTTDACYVGIRRKGESTQAVYTIRQAGENKAATADVSGITLDNAHHTLRVTLFPDGKVYGYLDERLFGVHEFEHCNTGSIGIVAWGPGDQKIYFDDLKLFALP